MDGVRAAASLPQASAGTNDGRHLETGAVQQEPAPAAEGPSWYEQHARGPQQVHTPQGGLSSSGQHPHLQQQGAGGAGTRPGPPQARSVLALVRGLGPSLRASPTRRHIVLRAAGGRAAADGAAGESEGAAAADPAAGPAAEHSGVEVRPCTAAESADGAASSPASFTDWQEQGSGAVAHSKSTVKFEEPAFGAGLAALPRRTKSTAGPLTGSSSMSEQAERQAAVQRSAQSQSNMASMSFSMLRMGSLPLMSLLLNRDNGQKEQQQVQKDPLWFTSLNEFKPLQYAFHGGRYMTAYFACSLKTGEHFVLKKYQKGKMSARDERGVRRAIELGQQLRHPYLVQSCGLWESADEIFLVEEYANKGDVLHDMLTYPGKYSEAYVAVQLVKPLLEVLAYLHDNHVIHRALFPENLMMRHDSLQLGHLNSAIDQHGERPKSPTGFIDYRAPEMITLKSQQEAELLFSHTARELRQQQQRQQQQQEQERQQQGQGLGIIEESAGEVAEQQQEQAQEQGQGRGDSRSPSPIVPKLQLGKLTPNGISSSSSSQGQKLIISPRSARYLAASGQAAAAGAANSSSPDAATAGAGQARQSFTSLDTPAAGQPRAPAALHVSSTATQQPPSARPSPRPARASSSSILTPRQQVQATPRGNIDPEEQQAQTSARGGFRRWASNSASQLLQGIMGSFRSRRSRFTIGSADLEEQLQAAMQQEAWQRSDHYDEKVDIWQVGCLVHELLCGCLPFEMEDNMLSAAHILWADPDVFPSSLSPQCVSFIRAALTKDPGRRPSAAELLLHPWVVGHVNGTIAPKQQQEAAAAGWRSRLLGCLLQGLRGACAALRRNQVQPEQRAGGTDAADGAVEVEVVAQQPGGSPDLKHVPSAKGDTPLHSSSIGSAGSPRMARQSMRASLTAGLALSPRTQQQLAPSEQQARQSAGGAQGEAGKGFKIVNDQPTKDWASMIM